VCSLGSPKANLKQTRGGRQMKQAHATQAKDKIKHNVNNSDVTIRKIINNNKSNANSEL
jgi:hypothetical protein